MARKLPLALASTLLLTLLFSTLGGIPHFLEPDRFYHLALLREMVGQDRWVLRVWPQFPLLGWSEFFSDKEFLFHWLLQFPYRALGENAVLVTNAFFAATLVSLPLWLNRRAPFFAFALSLALFLAHPHLLFRFSLLRPHVLATLLFAAFAYAFLVRRARLAAFLLFLFPLAYHAFYLPLFFLALAFGAESLHARFFGSTEEPHWRAGWPWLVAGMGIGILLHPHFPGNLVQTAQHLLLPFRSAQVQENFHLQFGRDLLPPNPVQFALAWLDLLIALPLAFVLSLRARPSRELFFLGIFSITTFALCLVNLRLMEFAAPIWVIFLAGVFAELRIHWRGGVLLALLLVPAPQMWRFVSNWNDGISPSAASLAPLLAKVPIREGERVRIFHDNWGLGPYIAYLNPRAEAIDALDPTFLLLANPQLTGLRAVLVAGKVGKPVAAMREAFGASYALCEPSALQWQLMHTPGVKPLATTPDRRFILFELPAR